MLINSLNNKIDKHFPEKNKIILVSACLLGINCAYDNLNNRDDNVLRIMKYRKLLPICPEQLGGLPTPREPQCIIKGNGHDVLKKRANVINRKNIDVTDNFLKGAAETIKLVKLYEIKHAIMKERSPSCGVKFIFNKSANDEYLIKGCGVTSAKLLEKGIILYSENELKELF